MSPPSHDAIRAALLRHLETDLLLGVRAVPLRRPQRPAASPAGQRGAAPPARPSLNLRTPMGGNRSTPPRAEAAAPAPRAAAQPRVPSELALVQLSPEELASREAQLRELDEQQVRACRRCGLCDTRTQTVFGQGSAAARLVFVGEAPGHDEDVQGLAFVGKAGQLLTKMIEAMGLTRDEVYICNVLKCRPPNNRTPAPDEISACWPFLDQQLRIIQPEVIVALGKPASQTLLRTSESISRLRGHWHDYYVSGSPGVGDPTPLMPTFHPAYLLRSPNEKGKAWSDLKMVMERLGFPPPASKS